MVTVPVISREHAHGIEDLGLSFQVCEVVCCMELVSTDT